MDRWMLRAVLAALSGLIAFRLRPFGLAPFVSALAGVGFAAIVVALELRLRRTNVKALAGAALGAGVGVLASFLIAGVLGSSGLDAEFVGAAQLICLLFAVYLGLVIGAANGESLGSAGLDPQEPGAAPAATPKIFDTSVIIDGRIVDVIESGFLDGPLIVPQFVLWELQLVADSSDSVKRNRGRRGLDMLQRLQKMSSIEVNIVENDYPKLHEVDQKLIELAKEISGKVITNDFNLNKLARLQGVAVLNVNELANALKPVVLPAETMKVFILKEGKEFNQGVAYLDDGTMVVVDNARRQISKTVEVSVTSVLQTTAGKMIFARYEGAGADAESSARRKSPGESRAYSGQKVEQGAGR